MSQGTQTPADETDADPFVRALRKAGLDVRPIPRGDSGTDLPLPEAVGLTRGPMLFRGLADEWPARTNWTPAVISKVHGDKVVTALMHLPGAGILYPKDQREYERRLTLTEFLEAMQAASGDNPCYLAYTRPDGLLPNEDYDFSALTSQTNLPTDTRIWLGSAGTRSALHSDLKDNFFCQIWGKKRVVLMAWKYSKAAYPLPDNIVNSQVDLLNLDLARFPRLRSSVLYSQVLQPGDVVFIPRGCWHDFTSLTPSISINHWFGPSVRTRDYVALLLRLGSRYWIAAVRDFVGHGVMRRPEKTLFFFSPSSTGKRLYNLVRWGDFSRDNDPASDELSRTLNR